MKKQIFTLLAGGMLTVCSMFAFTTSASAFMVGSADVGGLDTFKASAIVNSGDASEIAWVNQVLGTNYTSMIKYNNQNMFAGGNTVVPGLWNWRYVNNSTTVVAQDLQGAPEYFFIKTGNVTPQDHSDSPPDHFLFKNDANLNWAVIDLSNFGNDFVLSGFGVLSHVGELGSSPVPEPGTMVFLGAGLFGLAVWQRRRANR